MLFTRCPDCETTFRVTDEALKKAHGQVRCGRCASVFNAYAELRDPHTGAEIKREPPAVQKPSVSADPVRAAETGAAADAANPAPAATAAPPTATPPAATAAPAAAPTPAPKRTAAPQQTARFESLTVADVVKQVEAATTDEDDDPGEMLPRAAASGAHPTISAERVNEVLDTDAAPVADAPWLLDLPVPQRSRRWTIAAGVAAFALGAQIVHHFRAELVGVSAVGPVVKGAYAMFGSTVVPRWDVRQYEILDWIATAEPNSRGQGALKITARIQNRGPRPQPYPSVQLRLKDRWEAAVGSRMFAPAEYLGASARGGDLMAPGETTRAQIEVVDPGPDAYGFELDVCIEIETDQISCGTDKVFL
jgi:predicted Zn finger-like uncharacterized protein